MHVLIINRAQDVADVEKAYPLKAEDIAVEIDRLEKERDRKAVENQVEKMK